MGEARNRTQNKLAAKRKMLAQLVNKCVREGKMRFRAQKCERGCKTHHDRVFWLVDRCCWVVARAFCMVVSRG